MGDVRYELLAEEDVPKETLARAGQLLCEAFGPSRARRRGWNHRRPLYRVLVWDGDVLVGNESGCLVGCEPAIVLHGMADAAVRADWRSTGIARTMGGMIHQEAIRRGATAMISNTGALGRVAMERGMAPVRPGELYLRRRFRRDLPLVANWYIQWHGRKVATLTIDGPV